MDLNECRVDLLVSDEELVMPREFQAAGDSTPDPMAGDLPGPVGQPDTGGLELATRYQNVGQIIRGIIIELNLVRRYVVRP